LTPRSAGVPPSAHVDVSGRPGRGIGTHGVHSVGPYSVHRDVCCIFVPKHARTQPTALAEDEGQSPPVHGRAANVRAIVTHFVTHVGPCSVSEGVLGLNQRPADYESHPVGLYAPGSRCAYRRTCGQSRAAAGCSGRPVPQMCHRASLGSAVGWSSAAMGCCVACPSSTPRHRCRPGHRARIGHGFTVGRLRACDLRAFVVVDDPGHVEAIVVDVEPDSRIAAGRPGGAGRGPFVLKS